MNDKSMGIFLSNNKISKVNNFVKRIFLFNLYIRLKLIKTRFFMPSNFLIEPTSLCNLQCRLCCNPSLKRKKGQLSYKNFKKIFDQIKSYARHIDFDLAGEPLINNDTLRMVKLANSYGVRTSLATNAHFLTEDRINEIIESGLDKIIISFGGMTDKTYLFYHKGGNFEMAKKNIINLCKKKAKSGFKTPHIEISFLVTKMSEKEIPIVYGFAKNNNVDTLLLKSLHAAWDENGEIANLIPIDKRFIRKFDNKLFCSAFDTFCIMDNGCSVSCCYDLHGETSGANVLEEGVRNVWFKEYNKRKMMMHKMFSICKNCPTGFPSGICIKTGERE